MATAMGVAVTATVALTSVFIGGATVVSYHLFHSGQHESLSAYNPAPRRPRRQWLIATEEGSRNVRVCRYASEAAARAAFNKIWCARILYNPRNEEVALAGFGFSSHANIRQAMREGYFTRPPSPTRRAFQQVMQVAIPIAATVIPLVI